MRFSTAGAILAGGKGTRIGGAKATTHLLADPLAAHVAAVVRPHVRALAVVGDAQAATMVGAELISDETSDALGPLAGVLASLDWAWMIGVEWVVICPCDTPLLPDNLVDRLFEGAGQFPLCFAETPGGPHPLVSLWRVELRKSLRDAVGGGHPPVREVMKQFGAAPVHFADEAAFLNVNTPADLAQAEELLIQRARARSPSPHRS